MRRQSHPITPHETCLELFWSKFNWTVYFDFVLSPVFKYKAFVGVFSGRFIFLHLSTLPRSDFLDSHVTTKNVTDLFCFERAHYKVFIFMFSFMAYANLATSPKCLETELTNITRRHFCSLPIYCIEHSFIYFLLSELFPVICLFWHTLTARDDTRTRQHTRQGRK